MPRPKLEKIAIQGFKSLKSCEISLKNINVLIGANGAGKSNLISFLKMLNYMTTQALQRYIADSGFANSLLYYGAKTTPQIETTLTFQAEQGENKYHARLFYVAGDTLAFADETVEFAPTGQRNPVRREYGAGHKESALHGAKGDDKTAKVMNDLLSLCRVFQFHDTSPTAHVRQHCELDNNRYLYHDAGNLASFLYRLQQMESSYFERIVATIRQMAPFFGEFVLEPLALNPTYTSLRWRERDTNYEFGPHQLSDGTIRAMALITLLLQPEERLPALIVLDEPELGLHPTAAALVCSLIRQASNYSQVVLATQSTFMLDEFEPEDVIVVERQTKPGQFQSTDFRRLDIDKLKEWVDEFSLADLWEKNVLGGNPRR